MKSYKSMIKVTMICLLTMMASSGNADNLTSNDQGPFKLILKENDRVTYELQITNKTEFKSGDKLVFTRLSEINVCDVNKDAILKMRDPKVKDKDKPKSYCRMKVPLATSSFITYSDSFMNTSICKMVLGNDYAGTARGYINFNYDLKNTYIYTAKKSSVDADPAMDFAYLGNGNGAGPDKGHEVYAIDCYQDQN